WVRDLLLKRKRRITDIDFVCIGSGITLAEKISKKLGDKAVLKVFKNFGTSMISFAGENYEFVGARKESYRRDSRKPIIEDGTLEDDQNGLIDEVKSLMSYRKYNALNTVGYKELFDYIDGKNNLENSISMIKQNTRRLAKRQITWFKKDKEINWFNEKEFDLITSTILK
ncbi:hypothetical protein N9Q36_02280, partial [Flavobacteriales bacterium]|nr:hypothetical protein [Flavobacteriales bacterium]